LDATGVLPFFLGMEINGICRYVIDRANDDNASMHVFDFFVAGKLSVSASETAGASSCLLPFTRYVRMHVQPVICFIACR
jgi:hypothetical protein